MEHPYYQELTRISLQDERLPDAMCLELLTSASVELLPLLNAAYQVRKTYFQNEVQLHILNNAQNGYCPEDCHYCAQANSATADIETYSLKPDSEIVAEAERACESGAHRYCIVMSGRAPSPKRVAHLARLIQHIKAKYPIELCLSVGLIEQEAAQTLKAAGLDRLNHNLNTSETHYPKICSTHTYQDRMATLKSAQAAGLACCSGVIVGMGEEVGDIIQVAKVLRRLEVASIPVNFFLPIPGAQLSAEPSLTPEFCLRVLCLYRLLNPRAEIRVAAGREYHLRSLEPLALYPANSLFLEGYLNAAGAASSKTLRMIEDAQFTVKNAPAREPNSPEKVRLKELEVLRPRIDANV